MIVCGGPATPAASASDAAREKVRGSRPTVLVTGGAGFIGTNLCTELLDLGCRVRVLDDLSRPGAPADALHLQMRGGARLELLRGDVRRRPDVERAVAGVDAVFHLAARQGVTADPRASADVCVRGTRNVVEALCRSGRRVPLLHGSTKAVYGGVDNLRLLRRGRRYQPCDDRLARTGIDERALAPRAPHGSATSAAERSVLDHARDLGLPATVFRMSCVFGAHQRGDADGGWVAHFLMRALRGEPIAIRGDGRQVRDVLCVDDLVRAFVGFLAEPELLAGRAFNVGGGCTNAVSLLELLELVGTLTGARPRLAFRTWRPRDERWYVSDTRRLYQAIGWRPEVSVLEGLGRLQRWLAGERRPAHGSSRSRAS